MFPARVHGAEIFSVAGEFFNPGTGAPGCKDPQDWINAARTNGGWLACRDQGSEAGGSFLMAATWQECADSSMASTQLGPSGFPGHGVRAP